VRKRNKRKRGEVIKMSNTQVDTPYASFNAASREVSSNGGAWYPSDSETTIIPHQSIGGATDLFQLTGVMEARIVIPRDVAQIGDIINEYVSYLSICHSNNVTQR
jgi:hypothetical protein